MYLIIRLFANQRKFVLEIVFLRLKIGINAFIRGGGGGGLYEEWAFTWRNTSVKEKVGLSAGGCYMRGLYVKLDNDCDAIFTFKI